MSRRVPKKCDTCGGFWLMDVAASVCSGCATAATITTLRSQLAEAKADNARLREALEGLLRDYCSLVDSGDCGCWESKDDECVIVARKALTPTEPSK